MGKFILSFILLVASYSVCAKDIYIFFSMNTPDAYRLVYTVDPKLKVWNLMTILHEAQALDFSSFMLVRKTIDGFVGLNKNNTLGDYGDTNDSPVRFFVIGKSEDVQQETESSTLNQPSCPGRIGPLFCRS